MAGWGHKHLADLGKSLRPYLNPSAVEETKSRSSRSTKPTWQRELEQIDDAQIVGPDEIKGSLASSQADAEGRALYPTRGRGGHLDAMPADYRTAQAVTHLDKGTDTKEGDILAKALRGDVATDYQVEKDKLARAVMKDETAALRQQGVVDANEREAKEV